MARQRFWNWYQVLLDPRGMQAPRDRKEKKVTPETSDPKVQLVKKAREATQGSRDRKGNGEPLAQPDQKGTR